VTSSVAEGELIGHLRCGSVVDLREWAADTLSEYKLPKELKIVLEGPCNAMGKVTKTAVLGLFR